MKIVLATLNAKFIHSSLALRYLQAYVQGDFPNAEILEFTIKDPATRIAAELYTRYPAVVGFSVYIWNIKETQSVVRMLRKVLPKTLIVLGGPEVSYDTRAWMEDMPEVDVIVQGEGEATFHQLVTTIQANLRQGTPLHRGFIDVRGIVFRSSDAIHQTPPRPKLALDEIPSPYADDADLASLQNRIVYFETSRGCPFSCQFCLSSIESGVRYFSLARAKAELQRIIDARIRTVKFVDRTFNLNRNYALELFQFLIDHARDTVFQFEITGDILPVEIVDFLRDHAPKGLFRFEIGVQSTNDATNAIVSRRQNFERLSRTIRAVKESGKIVQHLDLIAGLPEEDYDSFRKTFDDVFAFEPDELQLGFLKMLRGTGLRRQAEQFGYVFMEDAPYEILFNRVLPYDDVLRIKQVEDVLEKYWNEGKLRNTVRYLTRHAFGSPFDFFQRFGSYWQQRGWDTIGHQLEDLFVRLDAFLDDCIEGARRDAARSYMVYDYLMQYRIRPQKVWWSRELGREQRLNVIRLAVTKPHQFGSDFKALNLTELDVDKHSLIERIPSVIFPKDPDRQPESRSGLVLVYYPPGLAKGERPLGFVFPSEQVDVHFV